MGTPTKSSARDLLPPKHSATCNCIRIWRETPRIAFPPKSVAADDNNIVNHFDDNIIINHFDDVGKSYS
jgi:hypothetical protein